MIIIVVLCLAGSAFAGTKFINKDTAKDRQDIRFGTRTNRNDISIQSDNKSNRISTMPRKEEENVSQPVGPVFVVPEIKPNGN